MSQSTIAPPPLAEPPSSGEPGLNEKILFWASFLTLIAAGIGFSVRGAVLADWGEKFGFTQGELGLITGGGLTGFGLTIIFFSFFADRVGYGSLMVVAFLLHASSALVTLAAGPVFTAYGKDATYMVLSLGMFLFALGNGTCEAVINPLTADLYPRNKTHWLNILHAGWPAGLVIGALLTLGFEQFAGVPWELKMSIFLVPTAAYGLQEVGLLGAAVVVVLMGYWGSLLLDSLFSNFSGVPGWTGKALATALAAGVLFVFGTFSNFRIGHWMLAALLIIHAMVGYVELGTDSWIPNITGTILNDKSYGLMLFIWTSMLMFFLRFCAGPIVHRISPIGLLLASAVLGCTGLVLLGTAEGILMCVVAATIYGFGKTFLWPTMLGVVSERFPRGGALTIGMAGGVGMLSAGLLGGPGIGYKQDYFASNKLEVTSPDTYDRYKAQKAAGFLFYPEVRGLDGAKVAVVMDKGEQLKKDIANFESKGGKLIDGEKKHPLAELREWWEKAEPFAGEDKPRVKQATLVGGQSALVNTAYIPATMAVCYLLLLVYFLSIGGYKANVLVGHAAEDEKFTGGVPGASEM
jgi:MFS family permease